MSEEERGRAESPDAEFDRVKRTIKGATRRLRWWKFRRAGATVFRLAVGLALIALLLFVIIGILSVGILQFGDEHPALTALAGLAIFAFIAMASEARKDRRRQFFPARYPLPRIQSRRRVPCVCLLEPSARQ